MFNLVNLDLTLFPGCESWPNCFETDVNLMVNLDPVIFFQQRWRREVGRFKFAFDDITGLKAVQNYVLLGCLKKQQMLLLCKNILLSRVRSLNFEWVSITFCYANNLVCYSAFFFQLSWLKSFPCQSFTWRHPRVHCTWIKYLRDNLFYDYMGYVTESSRLTKVSVVHAVLRVHQLNYNTRRV